MYHCGSQKHNLFLLFNYCRRTPQTFLPLFCTCIFSAVIALPTGTTAGRRQQLEPMLVRTTVVLCHSKVCFGGFWRGGVLRLKWELCGVEVLWICISPFLCATLASHTWRSHHTKSLLRCSYAHMFTLWHFWKIVVSEVWINVDVFLTYTFYPKCHQLHATVFISWNKYKFILKCGLVLWSVTPVANILMF